MLHEDGSACRHAGPPVATAAEEGGPLCPEGVAITHIMLDGRKISVTEAIQAFSSMAQTISKAIASLGQAFAEFGRKLAEDPGLKILAEAAERIERGKKDELG